MSLCSKPGCGGAAAAVLSYDYASSLAVLEDPPDGMADPHIYVLCASCADKLVMPRGWTLDDQREAPPLFLPRDPNATTYEVVEVVGAGIGEDQAAESQQIFFGHSA